MATKQVSAKEKLSAAIKCTPSYEKIQERYCILDNGTMYFVGDRSWVKIENLCQCNSIIRIGMKDLCTIMDMPGDNPSITVIGEEITGSDGRRSIKMKAITNVEAPNLNIPEASRFSDIADIFSFAKDLYPLKGPNTTISTMNYMDGETRKGAIVVHDSKFVAAISGNEAIEGDITNIGSSIDTAVRHKGKFLSDAGWLYIRIEFPVAGNTPVSVITVGMKLSASTLSENTRNMAISGLTHTLLEGVDTIIDADIKDIISLSEVIGLDADTKLAKWNVSEEELHLQVNETIGRCWEDHVPVTASSQIEFTSRLITRNIANAIASAAEDKSKLKIKVDPYARKLCIEPIDENPRGFLIMGISLQR